MGLNKLWSNRLAEVRGLLASRYPLVDEKVSLAERRLASATNAEDFQQVGLICRDIWIEFARAIYSDDFVPSGQDAPSVDQVNRRIELTLSYFGQFDSRELRQLVKAIFAYTQRLQHNREANPTEATRCLLVTALALGEMILLIEEAAKSIEWFQRYGVYKCQACGSTKLEEDVAVDYDKDGAMSGTPYLFCTNCGWTA